MCTLTLNQYTRAHYFFEKKNTRAVEHVRTSILGGTIAIAYVTQTGRRKLLSGGRASPTSRRVGERESGEDTCPAQATGRQAHKREPTPCRACAPASAVPRAASPRCRQPVGPAGARAAPQSPVSMVGHPQPRAPFFVCRSPTHMQACPSFSGQARR